LSNTTEKQKKVPLKLEGFKLSTEKVEIIFVSLSFQLRASIAPAEINFPAYTRDEISKIITTRLHEFNADKEQPIIRPAAITFLSAKISTLSGDVRKALDVCRRAIELSELEARKQTLLKPLDASPGGRPSGLIKPIDVPQILKIVNEVYCSSVTSSMGQKNSDLPLHQVKRNI
jgi:cell division control protein 6